MPPNARDIPQRVASFLDRLFRKDREEDRGRVLTRDPHVTTDRHSRSATRTLSRSRPVRSSSLIGLFGRETAKRGRSDSRQSRVGGRSRSSSPRKHYRRARADSTPNRFGIPPNQKSQPATGVAATKRVRYIWSETPFYWNATSEIPNHLKHIKPIKASDIPRPNLPNTRQKRSSSSHEEHAQRGDRSEKRERESRRDKERRSSRRESGRESSARRSPRKSSRQIPKQSQQYLQVPHQGHAPFAEPMRRGYSQPTESTYQPYDHASYVANQANRHPLYQMQFAPPTAASDARWASRDQGKGGYPTVNGVANFSMTPRSVVRFEGHPPPSKSPIEEQENLPPAGFQRSYSQGNGYGHYAPPPSSTAGFGTSGLSSHKKLSRRRMSSGSGSAVRAVVPPPKEQREYMPGPDPRRASATGGKVRSHSRNVSAPVQGIGKIAPPYSSYESYSQRG
jgi:hypothetical protein